MRTKVCGIRNRADAETAIAGGAHALGFLVGITHVAEDKISKEDAAAIIKTLPPFLSSVLVTHLTDWREIVSLATELGVTTVQIHDYIPPEDVARVRSALPFCKIIKAIHIITREDALAMMHEFETVADALLLDSRTADRLGGTGKVHDWSISAQIVAEARVPVILAGGLTADNVYEAVMRVKPFGVDVNSGVETDGWKDLQKVSKYVSDAIRARKELEDQ